MNNIHNEFKAKENVHVLVIACVFVKVAVLVLFVGVVVAQLLLPFLFKTCFSLQYNHPLRFF